MDMNKEILKTAYDLGSEAYWALRAEGEQLPQHLMDKLIAIADAIIMEEKNDVKG